jgi:diguanylate cyclase (GGDEF)-like protein
VSHSRDTPVDIQLNYPVDLSNCAKEPIHIPGSIQPHGVLMVAGLPNLDVRYVSANTDPLLGMTADSILGRGLDQCLGNGILKELLRLDEDGNLQPEAHRVVTLPFGGRSCHFDIRHFQGLLYLEIQEALLDERDDQLPANAQVLIDSMRTAGTLDALLSVAALQLRKLTNYDRVMVYRFNEDGHGHVIAEDCHSGMDPYLDLHYPASDIPEQARRLYLLQRIRVLCDVDYVPVPMLATAAPAGTPPPLDMTYCDLRSMSPVHIEYLKNMGVGATLTLSLIVEDQLWGLLVCHHREPKRPSQALRSSCDLLSQIISFMIRQTVEHELASGLSQRKNIIAQIGDSFQQYGTISDGLAACGDALLHLVSADGALICFDGKQRLVGTTPGLEESLRVMGEVRTLSAGKNFGLNSMAASLPQFEPLRAVSSGIMLLSIVGSPEDGILWFRPEVIRTVQWGGNPDKPVQIDSQTGRIAPRKSFEAWKRLVELHALPWRPIDFEAVVELKRTITAFIMNRAESLLSRSNLVDILTQLPNRRQFQETLREWNQDTDLQPVAVIVVGLDRFKRVNEAFGHATGDDLLIQVSRRLSPFISNDLRLARLGGDEFAALCKGMTTDEVEEIARQIAEAMSAPFQVHGRSFRITASLGVAHSSQGGREELLRAADTAMHLAKHAGRNRAISFDKASPDATSSRLELEQDLYRALEGNEFRLMYQPILSLSGAELYGFEALVRWDHPQRGTIPPSDFISIAEETGLILPIGRWIMREAVKTLQKWSQACTGKLTMHVNVAAPQLVSPDFVSFVVQLSREYGLEPHTISIEVTESVLMRDLAVDSLRDLRNFGFGVSVDDFGTGYSSLAYLKKLPVDTVKIDRSFINDIVIHKKSLRFLSALIQLIRTLDLNLIAEGVETETQSQLLLELGCTWAQGYYFSRPMDKNAAEKYLSEHANGSRTAH